MKYESNNFQFEAEMPWESAGEGIVRQIMGYNDNLMWSKSSSKQEQSERRIHIRIRKRLM